MAVAGRAAILGAKHRRRPFGVSARRAAVVNASDGGLDDANSVIVPQAAHGKAQRRQPAVNGADFAAEGQNGSVG